MKKGINGTTRVQISKTAALIIFIANILVGVYVSSMINTIIGLGGLVLISTHILVKKWRRDHDNGICW